jgi:hypothetical protein
VAIQVVSLYQHTGNVTVPASSSPRPVMGSAMTKTIMHAETNACI